MGLTKSRNGFRPYDNDNLETLAEQLFEQLDAALMWDSLSDGRREALCRASNAVELVLALIRPCEVRKSVTI